jgi:glycosyltransferase involved in cell wall biosynthesis
MKWLCCQLGAREHYAIPRALFRVGMLECLVTDAWVQPSSLLGRCCGHSSKFQHRFQSELHDARVKAFNPSLVLFEMLASARNSKGWQKILSRNRWFQHKVVAFLRSEVSSLNSAKEHGSDAALRSQLVLCSYSYTALEPFRYARSLGWRTLLVQIDPGPDEERIVAEETARKPELAGEWHLAPPEYWASWRQECQLADRIVVNSEWSRAGLIRGGVPAEKISIIPLAYEAPEIRSQKLAAFAEATAATEVRAGRVYPKRFTPERPLRVLFLGLINLRKGVARLLEAAQMLRGEPVEFWMVGPVEIANATKVSAGGRVKWFGAVTRNQATDFYRDADVFILPTLSDGFAMTQLEAQAHGLPVIASKNCGEVVENDVNGTVLDEPSAACIARAVRDCIASPDRLEKLASASGVRDKFTLEALTNQLQRLGAIL